MFDIIKSYGINNVQNYIYNLYKMDKDNKMM